VFSYQITANNSPTLFGATSLPDGLTVNTNTGLISGTPAASGSYSAQIMVANAGGSNTAALSITILPAVPVITSANSATGQVNLSFSYTITASGSPTNFGAADLPGGLTLNPTNGLISGMPTNTGTFAVQLSAMSPSGSGYATLRLTIAPAPLIGTFTEGFENGFVGWALAQSDAYAPWYIQTMQVAHGGTNIACSGILNSYRTQSITSPVLTAGGSAVRLNFYHVYANNSDDPALLGIVVNNNPVQWIKTYSGNPLNLQFVSGAYPRDIASQLTNSNQYLYESLNISSYVTNGDKFKLLFYTAASYNYPSPGWVVDDISVTGVVVAEKPLPPAMKLVSFQAVGASNMISLTWSNNGVACVLEGSGTVTGGWSTVPAAWTTNGNWINTKVTNTAPIQFFRLHGL